MRTITVKGVGSVSVKPDFVVLSILLETKNQNYEKAMNEAAVKIDEISERLLMVGFEKDSLKTVDFNVRTDYDNKRDKAGNYHRVFNGYLVNHRLKLSFDFDVKALSNALSAIASCTADPELSVDFTVKEPSAVNEALLKNATENARKKAEILCAASNSKLGELVTIDYNWGELNVYSKTNYSVDFDCIAAPSGAIRDIDIDPDDIDATDTVTFVWQIA